MAYFETPRPLTVREVIQILKKLPPDSICITPAQYGVSYEPVEEVEEIRVRRNPCNSADEDAAWWGRYLPEKKGRPVGSKAVLFVAEDWHNQYA